jgi:hypothetical protein
MADRNSAQLDARIARLYGLTRDELRYILDPADVYGPDFPGETFRVLTEKETRQVRRVPDQEIGAEGVGQGGVLRRGHFCPSGLSISDQPVPLHCGYKKQPRNTMDQQPVMTTELVYGAPYDDLIFMPRERAEDLAAIHHALGTASTWREFFRLLPQHARAEVEGWFTEDELEQPADDQSFDRDDVPGVADGDWPGWAAQEMLSWVPTDIQEQYGRVEASAISGDCLALDVSQMNAIVGALEAHGFTCKRDDGLVERAAGYA